MSGISLSKMSGKILMPLSNLNKYGENSTAEHHHTEQGRFNCDLDVEGLTVDHALAIQRVFLGLNVKKDKCFVN